MGGTNWRRAAPLVIAGATTVTTPTPATVPLSGVAQIATGGSHTCARMTDATVKCWGANTSGQLGLGTTVATSTPTTVPGLTGVAQIALGGNHSCAVLADTTVKCWGANNAGQLGDKTTVARNVPTPIPSFTGVAQLALGYVQSAALMSDGTVRFWGCPIGDGGTIAITVTSTPTAITGLTGVAQISQGRGHSCARLTSGGLRCWGYDQYGQLGDGITSSALPPSKPVLVTVVGVVGATEIALGDGHTCARVLGEIRCWGKSNRGQVGDGSTDPYRLTPFSVGGWIPLAPLASARARHGAVLLPSGKLGLFGGGTTGSEVFDLGSSSFAKIAAMGAPRESATATALTAGVLVTGGTGGVPLSTAEIYDLATDAWSAAASLSERRSLHTASGLSGGQILIAGGNSASAEVFDPASSTFLPAGVMTTVRRQHTATSLPSGQVLLVGGTDGTTTTSTAELFAQVAAGSACVGSGQCSPGLRCVDGVCCKTACDAACSACDVAGSAGTCAPVPSGSPHGARTCGGYGCSAGVCATACSSDSSCDSHHFCKAGACVPNLSLGTSCGDSRHCESGFCVDGYCCDQACTGQCEACNATPGVCAPISGKPHGTRPACPAPEAGMPCRVLSCDARETKTCARCRIEGTCSADGASVTTPDGKLVSCAPLRCVDGACLSRCTSARDCAEGLECSSAGDCQTPAPTATDSGGCGVAHGPGPIGAFAMLLFGGMWRTARRRRGARR